MDASSDTKQWDELPAEEQTRLLDEFGRYQDTLPPSCSLELKIERFQGWLQARGIQYTHQ